METKRKKVAGTPDLREILEEQKYLCALTGVKLTPNNACFDHIKPLSKNGTSLKDNLQAVTKEANKAKQDFTMKEFIDLCYLVIKNRGKEFGYGARKVKK